MVKKILTNSTNSYIISNKKNECVIIDSDSDTKKINEYIKENNLRVGH